MNSVTQKPAEVDFTADDGIRHQLWVISDRKLIDNIVHGFAELGPIYIADGHHRSAAGSRVAKTRRQGGEGPDSASQSFLAVSFPESELMIMDYNRIVKDLHGLTESDFMSRVGEIFEVTAGRLPEPKPRHFEMYIDGAWHTLAARAGSFDPSDPVKGLDVSILQDQLLNPVLGIEDPRRDVRIGFVGGIRGAEELEKRVNEGFAVAFKLHATSIAELLSIADAGEVMPPKSTWFEPKLRDGLVVHQI